MSIQFKIVSNKQELSAFYRISNEVYKNIPLHRSTEEDITKLLIEGPSAFHQHASVSPYLITRGSKTVGRFALINDTHLPQYTQVSFFEALPDLYGIDTLIIELARIEFPDSTKIVFGLNGHLNYGAGFLLNKYNQPPVFGLPYTPEYYTEYFKNLKMRKMVSFRFSTLPFFDYLDKMGDHPDLKGITVRKLNKKKLKEETALYTYLNNSCFPDHPFWANREVMEDFELFHPFRFLIREENLLFAEKDGNAIGFFLWYPDFNELVKGPQPLGVKHVLKYKWFNPIKTFRFTEIAVLQKYQVSHAVQAMILCAIKYIRKMGIEQGEGGFIFEENIRSISMTKRFLQRVSGEKMEAYRQYAVFEKEL